MMDPSRPLRRARPAIRPSCTPSRRGPPSAPCRNRIRRVRPPRLSSAGRFLRDRADRVGQRTNAPPIPPDLLSQPHGTHCRAGPSRKNWGDSAGACRHGHRVSDPNARLIPCALMGAHPPTKREAGGPARPGRHESKPAAAADQHCPAAAPPRTPPEASITWRSRGSPTRNSYRPAARHTHSLTGQNSPGVP